MPTIGEPGPVVGFAPGEQAGAGCLLGQTRFRIVVLVLEALADHVWNQVAQGLESQLKGAVLGGKRLRGQ